jgi:hypothetical protein
MKNGGGQANEARRGGICEAGVGHAEVGWELDTLLCVRVLAT